MTKNNKYSETKIYTKLTRNKVAEEYCKTLEQMYTDVVSVPMFNDGDTHIEDWGIEFFHKESQQEKVIKKMTNDNCILESYEEWDEGDDMKWILIFKILDEYELKPELN